MLEAAALKPRVGDSLTAAAANAAAATASDAPLLLPVRERDATHSSATQAAGAGAAAAVVPVLVTPDTSNDDHRLAALAAMPAAEVPAAALLYGEMDVAAPTRKLMQARLYRRSVWEVKSRCVTIIMQWCCVATVSFIPA